MCQGRALPQTQTAPPVVAGNVKKHVENWLALGTTPSTVQDWIQQGVSIPFHETPLHSPTQPSQQSSQNSFPRRFPSYYSLVPLLNVTLIINLSALAHLAVYLNAKIVLYHM